MFLLFFHCSSEGLAVQYVVKKGDTLYSIARKYHLPLKRLIQQNGGSERIRVGQVLNLAVPSLPEGESWSKVQQEGLPPRARYRKTLEELLAEEDAAWEPGEENLPDCEASDAVIEAHRKKKVQSRLVRAALSYRGARYLRAGESPSRGFDCSGFTRFVYRQYLGITLPHNSRLQFTKGKPVPFKALKPGDLLFFKVRSRRINHVGIYIGNGKFVHAANPHRGVRIDSIYSFYHRYLAGARRLILEPITAKLHGTQ